MIFRSFLPLAVLLSLSVPLQAKAPKAPSKLRVTGVGTNAFKLKWKDNSNDELGWEIRVGLRGSTPVFFKRIAEPDITEHTILTNDLSGKTIVVQVLAYKGKEGKEKYSKSSPVAEATALTGASFGKSGKLKAKAVDDSRIRLRWKDKSTTEEGYQVQVKDGRNPWRNLVILGPDKRFSTVIPGFQPKSSYSFRVRAFKDGGATTTPFVKAKAKTKSFRAPAQLSALSEGEGELVFRWKDKSSIEAGFELEQSLNGSSFTKVGEVGANARRTKPLGGFLFGKEYKFRIRGFYNGAEGRVYSKYSNVAVGRPVQMKAPTSFVGKVTGDTSVNLKWRGNSEIATDFHLFMRKVGDASFSYLGSSPSDDPEADILGLTAGVGYEFKVRAVAGFAVSEFTNTVTLITTGASITSSDHPEIFFGQPFEHEVTVTDSDVLQSIQVSGLPAGLGYSASTRKITGAATEEGLKTVQLTATLTNGSTARQDLKLRIIRQPAAPVVTAPFSSVNIAVGGQWEKPLGAHFADPDTSVARRVSTTLGSFDVILYQLATPATVANFLSYADGGRYQDGFFHRSISNFVVQGGGYNETGGVFGKVVPDPAVANEPGISNTLGTVAMAKLPGDPDSATSEWFANVADNSGNLDGQNGGFTVFGRIAGDGLDVAEEINDLPTGDYTVDLAGESKLLEDVPMNDTTAPADMDATKLVRILGIDPVSPLSYSVASDNPSVATASVVDGKLVIDAVASGSATVQVTATDLDGTTTQASVSVSVEVP